VENTEEFEAWLYRLLKDSKQKLNMTDSAIAYILLREGVKYYFRHLMREEIEMD